MESIREIYRIGRGPSSSHTMGPARAAELFRTRTPHAASYRVTLFSSLAATGRGHMTDLAVRDALAPIPLELVWKPEVELPTHPNGMLFEALDSLGELLNSWEVFSVGGGALQEAGQPRETPCVYELTTMNEILKYCSTTGMALWEVVLEREGESIWDFLDEVWEAMQAAVERGLQAEGVLPGGLGVPRKGLVVLPPGADGRQQLHERGLSAGLRPGCGRGERQPRDRRDRPDLRLERGRPGRACASSASGSRPRDLRSCVRLRPPG